MSVGITCALERGCDTCVAVVSSGNVGVATAAYAAAGIRAVLFMHGQAGAGKIAQACAYGAPCAARGHARAQRGVPPVP